MKRLTAAALCDWLPCFVYSDFRRETTRASSTDGWIRARLSAFPCPKSSLASKVTDLTTEQFQFVRALYVAIPPVSRTLPPGDHAVMASSGGSVMLALVADGQACARFLAPDFIQAMLVEVGQTSDRGAGHADLPELSLLKDEKAQHFDARHAGVSALPR